MALRGKFLAILFLVEFEYFAPLKITPKNSLFKMNKPEINLTVKTLRREKHSRRLKIVREKHTMTSRNNGFP